MKKQHHCRGVPDPLSSSDSGEERQSLNQSEPPLFAADSHPNFPADITSYSYSEVKYFTKNKSKSDSDEDQSVSQTQVKQNVIGMCVA